ncbi:MAG: Lrp/AsnC family transcriptional regulator [Armatimonadetes bacterium]|nr:Lrp/AsnC family transcriptional regulator [Armatimonadota bacterium]
MLNKLEKEILNIIQQNFPISSNPYQILAKKLKITESKALEIIKKLIQKKIIRKIGPVFEPKKIGYQTTLIAMKIPPEKLKKVVELVNSFPQVTHNYGRNHIYNLWFTLNFTSRKELNKILNKIKEKTKIKEIYNLPALNFFKIKVNFKL